VLRHPCPDLRLVAAHCGLWGGSNPNNVPENSIRVVQNAAYHGIEMAEVGLKEMQDGTMILMHDFNLGRTINIDNYCRAITGSEDCPDRSFDPYRGAGLTRR